MIPPEDLEITVPPSKEGGQHVGCEIRGVHIVHLPTGIEVFVKCERSQHKNKDIAIDAITGALTSPHLKWSFDK